MTLAELLARAGSIHPAAVFAAFALVPVLAWAVCRFGDPNRSPAARWTAAVLVYLACVPGMLAAVLTAYTLFFLRRSLLDVDLLFYFLPIVSMILTLVVVKRRVPWRDLPGVNRLYGLMVLLGISFVLALALEKTRIWVFFGASIFALLFMAVICFLALKWAGHLLFRKREDPAMDFGEYAAKSAEGADLDRISRQLRHLKRKLKE